MRTIALETDIATGGRARAPARARDRVRARGKLGAEEPHYGATYLDLLGGRLGRRLDLGRGLGAAAHGGGGDGGKRQRGEAHGEVLGLLLGGGRLLLRLELRELRGRERLGVRGLVRDLAELVHRERGLREHGERERARHRGGLGLVRGGRLGDGLRAHLLGRGDARGDDGGGDEGHHGFVVGV